MKPSFTQNDLKSALQKVSSFKFLTESLSHEAALQEPPQPVTMVAFVEEKLEDPIPETVSSSTEVTILKEIVDELSGKVAQKEKELWQQVQDAKAQQELLDAKLRQAKLERDKTAELEIERYRQTIEELKASQTHAALAKEPLIEKLQTELSEQKAKIFRFLTEKKELEAQLAQENCEKETILARLKEYSRKNEHKDELQSKLKETHTAFEAAQKVNQALDEKIAYLEQELEKSRSTCQMLQAELEQSVTTLSHMQQAQIALQDEFESMKNAYKQELMVSQACVVERQAAFEAEQKAHRQLVEQYTLLEKESQHLSRDKQLIEQHLARRVKECMQLEKQLEDERARHIALQTSYTEQLQKTTQAETALEQFRNHDAFQRQEFAQKCAAYEERLAKLQERYDTLYSQNQSDLNELLMLRKLKERLQQLEKLFVQFSQVVTTPILAPPIFSSPNMSHELIMPQELP